MLWCWINIRQGTCPGRVDLGIISPVNTNPRRRTGLRRLPISWREILGLLAGLAICYGLIDYALINAPQYEAAASEQAQKKSEQVRTTQRTIPAGSDGSTKTVTVRVTGSSGERFSGNLSTLDGSHSLDGVVPVDYRVEVRADPVVADFLFATVQKADEDDKELSLQILDNGKVVKEGSTAVDHESVVSLVWSPQEHGPESTSSQEGTSAQSTEKAAPIGPSNDPAHTAAPSMGDGSTLTYQPNNCGAVGSNGCATQTVSPPNDPVAQQGSNQLLYPPNPLYSPSPIIPPNRSNPG